MGPEELWEGRSWSLAFKEGVAQRGGPQVVQGQGDVHSLLPVGQETVWACSST